MLAHLYASLVHTSLDQGHCSENKTLSERSISSFLPAVSHLAKAPFYGRKCPSAPNRLSVLGSQDMHLKVYFKFTPA